MADVVRRGLGASRPSLLVPIYAAARKDCVRNVFHTSIDSPEQEGHQDSPSFSTLSIGRRSLSSGADLTSLGSKAGGVAEPTPRAFGRSDAARLTRPSFARRCILPRLRRLPAAATVLPRLRPLSRRRIPLTPFPNHLRRPMGTPVLPPIALRRPIFHAH